MLRKRHLALRHRPFERVRARWQVEIGVSARSASCRVTNWKPLDRYRASSRGSISASKALFAIQRVLGKDISIAGKQE